MIARGFTEVDFVIEVLGPNEVSIARTALTTTIGLRWAKVRAEALLIDYVPRGAVAARVLSNQGEEVCRTV